MEKNERAGAIRQYLTHNDCYRAGRPLVPRGVMVHSTGKNNPAVARYVPGNDRIGYNRYGNHWDQPGVGKCVHAFVGKLADGSVGAVQTLPWTMRGWHAGGGANGTHIAFEICEDGLKDASYFRAVYQQAVELTAYLCQSYGLDPLAPGVVICHAEGHRLGIASNHADVEHWWPRFDRTMDDFRADVARALKGGDIVTYEQWVGYMERYRRERAERPPSDWAEEELEEAVRAGLTDGCRPQDFATRQETAAMAWAAARAAAAASSGPGPGT